MGAEDDSAELKLKIGPSELLRYNWVINSVTDSTGKDQGRAFKLTSDSGSNMTLLLRGQPGRRDKDSMTVSIRVKDQVYTDKRSVDASISEMYVSKTRVKCTDNGKVVIDSDNDIGLDRLGNYQEHFKNQENAEMRVELDAAGRQSDVQGDPTIVDSIKASGAQGIFPILPAKSVKVGESWEDSFSMPKIGEFKLARAAVVKSKMTFVKWETKDGRKLAHIDVASSWDNQDLRGENATGMLVEITRVDGRGSGNCLFDPATGHFVEGNLSFAIFYRIDGEHKGQSTGLEVSGKTRLMYSLQK